MGEVVREGACRVLVVSERSLVGETVASMVQRGGDFSSHTVNSVGLDEALERLDPHIVVIDVADRPGAEGVAKAVVDLRDGTKVVFLVDQPGMWSDRACRALGVVASLSCNLTGIEFVSALDQLRKGERLRRANARPQRVHSQRPDDVRVTVLTPREVEVLVQLGLGEPPEEIARSLGISANTVRTHVQNLMLKLAVHSRLEAVSLARRAGLLNGRSKASRTERFAE